MKEYSGDLLAIELLTNNLTTPYDKMLSVMRGLFTATLSTSNPTAAHAKAEFNSAAENIAMLTVNEYQSSLESAANDISEMIKAKFTPEEWGIIDKPEARSLVQEYAEALVDDAVSRIYAYALSDIRHGNNKLRELSMNVAMTMNNAGLQNAIKGAVVKSHLGGGVYTNNGKKWKTLRYAELTTRHAVLTLFNELTMILAARLGENEFVITNEIDHRHTGKKVSIDGLAYDKYDDIKGEIFHPNSKSLIYRVNKSAVTSI